MALCLRKFLLLFIYATLLLVGAPFAASLANSDQPSLKPMTTSVSDMPLMLRPLGLRTRSDVGDTKNMNLNFSQNVAHDYAPKSFSRSVKNYGTEFNLAPQIADTPEALAAKTAYDVARNNFLSALRSAGEGVNAGQGSDTAQEQIMALGQQAFEAAGSAYLSGFLEKEFGKAEALASDAGSGKTFIHHVKKNLAGSAQDTVKTIVNDALSGTTDMAKVTDTVMLAGARGVIDAGLSAARRSDLYALRNLELEYSLNNFKYSYMSALITQPLHQSIDLRHNFFLQGSGIVNERSVDIDDDVARHTINVGAAYRYLTPSEKYLLGGNIFFDHQWPYNHSRVGLGLDAKSKQLNLAANYYFPLSGYRDSRRDTDGNEFEERALEGFDVELGYNPPFVKGLGVFAKGYQYYRDTQDDIFGLEFSAEYNVLDNFVLKGAFVEENGGRDGVELALQYRIPLYDTQKQNLALADMEPAAGNDSVKDKIFEKVRRTNTIRVEERIKTEPTALITAQFNALSTGLAYDVGGVLIGAGVNLPFDTAITVPNGRFGIINFSNGALANISASGGGDVILQFNAGVLTVTTTNGGFVQFISGSGGISVVNVPGGTVNLLGTDIDVTDNGITTTIQVRAGAINVAPNVGVDAENGAQADIVTLTIISGATAKLTGAALKTRQESAFTSLDLINPLPPTGTKAAPFINKAPELITGPQFVGNNVDIRLTFTQDVSVTGSPHITGFIDANARNFIYNEAASSATQLVFRHVFIAADVGAAGVTVDALNLNGGTIIGAANSLNAITAFTSTVIAINDMTAPTLNSSTPADNEPAFNGAGNIVLNFNENVQANVGNIILTDTTDGSDNHVIPITDGAQVTIAGAVVTIDPTGALDLSNDYELTIGNNVIQDTDGNAFAGITSGALNFTTSNDVTPPTFNPATDSSPADNDTDVVLTENIVITFSEAVNKNVGNIEIRRTADNALLETIDVTTGLVTGGGSNTITINPANDYPIATDVYILIAAGAFQDLNGNAYAGIAATTAFNFRGFAPNDVPGILLWLDANDLDGDGVPEGASESGLSGGDAATWEDRSGNNNDMSHATPSRRPTLSVAAKNGRDILNFDGGDALFATDASVPTLDLNNNAFTMYAVVNPTNTNGRIIINKETTYEVGLNGGIVQGAVVTTAPGSWAWGGTGNNAISTAWHTVEFAHNNTMWDFYQDGALTETILPANNQTGNIQPTNNVFSVGGRGNAAPTGSFFLGDMAEILMFDHALSAAERASLEAYFNSKWGL